MLRLIGKWIKVGVIEEGRLLVSLYGKYSTQKKFREMLQMPRESFLQERESYLEGQDTAHGLRHLL